MSERSSWTNQGWLYIPQDRRFAMASGQNLPEKMEGAALFADISGFTPLTEALTDTLGLRRGAEELPGYLNAIYNSLIQEVERFSGSVISFAGDAITCWFDEQFPKLLSSDQRESATSDSKSTAVLRAVTCALEMQSAMHSFAEVQIPGREPVHMSIKVAVACGPVHRFLVGDPSCLLYDVMAGDTLYRLAEAEHLANRGEILLDEFAVKHLAENLEIAQWRTENKGTGKDRRFAVLAGLKIGALPIGWPDTRPDQLTEAQLCSWIHPVIMDRLQAGMGEYLTELRPTVAIFLRFNGINYDDKPHANRQLNDYIYAVQQLLTREGGSLLEITIGDKGSYLYISFGTFQNHEDDAKRAVMAALQLSKLHTGLDSGAEIQIGVSRGTMRTGEYGGKTRRSYGALGDDVNLAARLMTRATPGEVLISRRVHNELIGASTTGVNFQSQGLIFEPRSPIQLKGKAEPIPVFAVIGVQQKRAIRLQEPAYSSAMVGRESELKIINEKIDRVLDNHGQVIGITAEPGMGKSRLVAEAIRIARTKGLEGYGGACQSDGTQTPYLVWKPVWSAFFDLDPEAPLRRQIRNLEGEIEDLAPDRVESLPLLSEMLGLSLPENDFTKTLEPKHRCTALEALLLDCLRARAQEAGERGNGLLLVLEDVHWIDAASRNLLERIGRAISELPVLLILAYRPPEYSNDSPQKNNDGQPEDQSIGLEQVPYFISLRLGELSPAQVELAIRAKLSLLYPEWRGAVPKVLVERVIAQAQGNPFYAEEILNYLHDRDLDLRDQDILTKIELPTSLNSLVISRIDQLTASKQLTIKISSVLGRVFRFEHLLGYYPELGEKSNVKSDLEGLARLDLTPLDTPEPELTYLFKHLITHSVAYELLPYKSRARLHEQYGNFLESRAGDDAEKILDILAFHFDRSENLPKKREYLYKAGLSAQRRYANTAALDYFLRAIPLMNSEEQPAALRKLGQVQELIGHWDEAESAYGKALALSKITGNLAEQAQCLAAYAELDRKRGMYANALDKLSQANAIFTVLGDQDGIAQVLHFQGTVATHQGDYQAAQKNYEESLLIRRENGDLARAASLLSNLGIITRLQGNLAKARELNKEALGLRRMIGDKWAIAVSLNNLGNIAIDLGNFEEARSLHEEGLMLRWEVGDMWVVANSLNNLGNLARGQGDYPQAMARYQESLRIVKEYNDRWAMAYLLEDIGCLNSLQGHYEQAFLLLGAAESLREIIGAPRSATEQKKLDDCLKNAYIALEKAHILENIEQGRRMDFEQAAAYAATGQ